MEGREGAVDKLIAEILLSVAYLRAIFCLHYLGDALHDHFTVGLVFILESEVDLADDLDYSHLGSYFNGRLDQLLVVSLFGSHASDPEGAEVGLEDLLSDVLGLDALAAHHLLQHLQHYLPHLLVGRLELPDQSRHYRLYVLASVPRLHQGENEADSLEEGSKGLISDLIDAFPKGLKD